MKKLFDCYANQRHLSCHFKIIEKRVFTAIMVLLLSKLLAQGVIYKKLTLKLIICKFN